MLFVNENKSFQNQLEPSERTCFVKKKKRKNTATQQDKYEKQRGKCNVTKVVKVEQWGKWKCILALHLNDLSREFSFLAAVLWSQNWIFHQYGFKLLITSLTV